MRTTRDLDLDSITDAELGRGGYTTLPDLEVVRETERAVLVLYGGGVTGWNQQEAWLPKATLRQQQHSIFGQTVFIQRWFLSRNRLWDITS